MCLFDPLAIVTLNTRIVFFTCYSLIINAYFENKGPKSLAIIWRDPYTLNVTFIPGESQSDVTFYEAKYSTTTCVALAGAATLNCMLEGLQGGTSYRIQGKACVSKAECSGTTMGTGVTLPEGLIFQL